MGKSLDVISFLGELEQRYRKEIDALCSRSIEKYMIESSDRLQNLKQESENRLQQALIQMQKEYDSLSKLKDVIHELATILQEKLKHFNMEEAIDLDKLEEIELPEDVNAAIDKMIRDRTNQAFQLAQFNKSMLEAEKLIEEMKNKTIHRIEIIHQSRKIQLYIKKRQEIYNQKTKHHSNYNSRQAPSVCCIIPRSQAAYSSYLRQNTEIRNEETVRVETVEVESCFSFGRRRQKEKEEESCSSFFTSLRKRREREKKEKEEQKRIKEEEERKKLEQQEKKEEEEESCSSFFTSLRKRKEREKKEKEEQKRIKEEEDRKKLEEQRKKEEEEKLKIEEKRREQEKRDRMKKEIEDEEQAKKLRDSKYWPKYVYKSEDVEFDHKITCVIQCPEGVLSSKEDLNCEVILQTSPINFPAIDTSGDFVSSLIHVKQQNEEVSFNFNIPWKICIPYYAVRNPVYELAIMSYSGRGYWEEMDTKEVLLEDPLDNVTKFAEAKINDGPVDILFVVVSRIKVDRFRMGRKGGTVASSVDNRVNLEFPPECLDVNDIDIHLKVQPMDVSLLNDVKGIHPNETKDVITTSHIITLISCKRQLLEPVTINFTVPLNLTKSSRPRTAAAPKSTNAPNIYARPKTAAGGLLSGDLNEELRIVCRLGDDQSWKEWPEIQMITQRNKDRVYFDIENLDTFTFFAIRCVPNASDVSLVRFAEIFEIATMYRTLNLILRQHVNDMRRIVIVATPSDRISRTLQQLSNAGFEEGPEPSPDIVLCEREIIHLEFRGNISPIGCKETSFKLPYNSQMRNRIDLTVQEIDQYAQKASDHYRGFAQFFVTVGDRRIRITELLVNLPKTTRKEPKPLIKAPFDFKSENDSISKEYLEQLALELGNEWKVLARRLDFSREKIQSFQDRNVGLPLQDIIFDMFITWVKGVPVMTNKAQILIEALEACKRVDLAEELRNRELDYQEKLKERKRDE